MSSVGWLEDEGESLCTPRFDEHNGQSAKRRATETERKREARKVSAPDADKNRSREEKRREDISSTDVEDKSASAQRDKPAVATKPEGVSDSVWKDFLVVRKANRAPLTKTALDGIGREASKAGITLEQALSICCARGWRSFNASWKWRDDAQEAGYETPYQRAMRERVQEMSPSVARRAPTQPMQAVEFFEGQSIVVETKQLGVEP